MQPYSTNLLQDCPLAAALAGRLRDARSELTAHWLERVVERVTLEPNRVFPTDELLDHVPLLIGGIADYLEDPSEEITMNTPVVAKAMELGALRHQQGFDAYEILKEYEILGGILFSYLAQAADEMPEPCEKSELLVCGQRLFRAVAIIQQTTTSHYLRLSQETIADREERLRAFNRAISHEIKNKIGTVLGASELLIEAPELSDEQRRDFLERIRRNAYALKDVVENLIALSRSGTDARSQRHVRLPEAVQEAMRQVREAAQSRGVELRCGELPEVEVNAAAVELCLTNYLGNSIKYSDPNQQSRFAEVNAAVQDLDDGSFLVIRVRDNGLGVPEPKRADLFKRFFRAHETVTGAEGTGLGLSIVRDTAESLGGRAWAEFTELGSIFAFALPFRRHNPQDRRAAD